MILIRTLSYLGLLTLVMIGPQSWGHPTSYEGGFAFMGEMNPNHQKASFIYSPKYWLGVGIVGLRAPGSESLVAAQLGWLVKRWNRPAAQGNIYFVGGVGYAEQTALSNLSRKGLIYRYGAQADYETRRFFSFAKYTEHRFFNKNQVLTQHLELAVGIAPYLAKYNELNSWLILKFELTDLLSEVSWVPTIKFFYKNFLWEIGQSFEGHLHLNFMLRF